ncbi:HAD family hydrolase [Alicyclobacillus sp. SP_1]|uniref:HAD family hydrolase n=1 Tax=Alicyclobacillus sp. SP_1 TaxID=2942475 RepID=UPI00215778C3|nr:HAD family hydrolase [Alicyclobacillus sp. SP_1]
MQNPILFAIDIDGTLLNSRRTIDERTWTAIQDAMQSGHYVCLATGRMAPSALRWARFLKTNAPLVALNGADIVDLQTGESIHQSGLSLEALRRVTAQLEDMQIPCQFHGHQQVVDTRSNPQDAGLLAVPGSIPHVHVPSLLEYLQRPEEPVLKLVVQCPDKAIFQSLYEEWNASSDWSISRVENLQLNLNAHGVSKFSGIYRLLPRLRVRLENVVAIGNGENDREMIFRAGAGFAMENSDSYLLEHHPARTLSNDEGGVAHVLRRYVSETHSRGFTKTLETLYRNSVKA